MKFLIILEVLNCLSVKSRYIWRKLKYLHPLYKNVITNKVQYRKIYMQLFIKKIIHALHIYKSIKLSETVKI